MNHLFSTSSANSDSLTMLDCHSVEDRFGEYLDGSLNGPATDEIEHHLATCSCCAESFTDYRKVIAAAAELGQQEQPMDVGVQNRLRKALNERLGINLPYIA